MKGVAQWYCYWFLILSPRFKPSPSNCIKTGKAPSTYSFRECQWIWNDNSVNLLQFRSGWGNNRRGLMKQHVYLKCSVDLALEKTYVQWKKYFTQLIACITIQCKFSAATSRICKLFLNGFKKHESHEF